MSHHQQDRALAAVQRVRAARERDSRLGLQRALATGRQREEAAQAAASRLAAEAPFGGGSSAAFRQYVERMAALVAAQRDRAEEARRARGIADEASWRWQQDRRDLASVELLAERRAEQRRAERRRAEQRELDDIAAQRWMRRAVSDGARPGLDQAALDRGLEGEGVA